MKKTISIMFVFIVIYLGVMYLFESKYHYDWTPYPRQNAIVNQDEILTTDVLPTDTQDPSIQDSVITQGILPTENKNYLSQGHAENTFEDQTAEQKNAPKEQTKVEAQTEQKSADPAITQETTKQQVIQESAIKMPQQAVKHLTFKEQLQEKDLVDIETLPVKIFLDLRYATENNFTGKKLYKRAKCYLKKPAAAALEKAARAALNAPNPFYLCAYDCYRPASVQKILVSSTTQEGFVSRVSNHSRGMAIDIGPCDENGEALVTPTEFDTFSPLSAAYYEGDEIPQIAIENRTALQKVMKEAGFSTISKEWWHFDYKGAKNEEVLNIRF